MGLGFTHRAWRHGLVGTQLHPRIVEVSDIWKDFLSGDGTLSSQGATGPRRWSEGQLSPRAGSMSSGLSAISQWGWGVLGGIVLWGLRFRPRVVGVVEIWKDLRSRDGTISTPCAAGPRRGPEGQLFHRAGFMSSSHSETGPLSWSFHSVRAVSTREISVSSPSYWKSTDLKGFGNRGWELIILGCCRTSTLVRGATLAVC